MLVCKGLCMIFAKKISPVFSVVYCVIVYIISITLPSPRTASATHEIAIHPMFGVKPICNEQYLFWIGFVIRIESF